MSLLRRLVYLYVGSSDVDADLRLFVDQLGGELTWRFQEFGADVAGVRLGEGPMVLLADHRPPGSTIQIWTVADLDAALTELRDRGWEQQNPPVEIPDGTCLVVADGSGNEVGLLHQTRPDALSHHRPG
jgi:hypothetical protein